MSGRSRSDAGQVTAFVTTTALTLVFVFALVWEGGSALAERSWALSLAQEAARAGAQQIDLAAYRADEEILLDPGAAERAARNFLDQAGAAGTVSAGEDAVTVTAQLDYDFTLLPLGSRTLAASASAAPHTGP
ncbi:hypothetical protein O4J56_04630 [Nocardiopsis sp. RSe5-2]|uniref:Putative Flp pilus-assembly TadG-like N-terminal domain-containing protein n=1 Tax=Nocardiopsis endophytica TaxID=3018445 RepID=A0ABT4U0B3_9ACTN|nr:pilus assembly protein TadG-related protein [Nocardiopsis endophytica]MDA2809915.1 hypothetical protein [Nocardiopsis endophytica]